MNLIPWSRRHPAGGPRRQSEEETMKPDALSECLERLIASNSALLQAIQANTAMQSQLLAGLQKFRASSVAASPGAVAATGPTAQASSSSSTRTKEPPGTGLTQEEFTGLIFTLFCHHGSGAYDQDLLRALLESQIPSLTFAVVYREGMAIGDKYTDKPAGNPVRYWRISLGGRNLLLPCPAKPEAFYGTEGFDVRPPDSAIGPGTLEFCLPASLNREGDAWYIENKGQLCSFLPPGKLNRRDYVHLLNRKGAETPDSGASSPQPRVPPQTDTAAAAPLAERLAKAYVSFCQGGRENLRSFADMQELWRQSALPDRIVAHRVLREADRLLVADWCEDGKEHFWLVQLDNSLTNGWLFPRVVGNQFGILDPEYSFRDIHLAPENIGNMKPATVIKALGVQGQQSHPWRVEAKGELYRR